MIITEKVIKYPDRAEADRFFNYPYAAIEEALANAVYHKAYDEREPIEVRVTHDMIEIISHPGPEFETDEAHDYFVTRLFIHFAYSLFLSLLVC